VREQLALPKIGSCEVEDGSKNRLGVLLTKAFCEPAIVVDVSNEQRNRTARDARLGDRSRGSIDEGVEGSEPSLLIEKNEMLLRAGRSRCNDLKCRRARFDNRKNKGANDAREKSVIYVAILLHFALTAASAT
jgi:hypothetical protein